MDSNKQAEEAAKKVKDTLSGFTDTIKDKTGEVPKKMELLSSMFQPYKEKQIIYKGQTVKVTLSKRGYITLGMNLEQAEHAYLAILKTLEK